MTKLFIPAVVLAVLFTVSASTVQAGPFEKAGLTADAGRKLSDQEADQVRGGFRGGALLDALGIDSSLSREEIRAALQSLGRDAIRAALADSGIERPSMGGDHAPPQGVAASRAGQRAGVRARSFGAARR